MKNKSRNQGIAVGVALFAFIIFFSLIGFGSNLADPLVSTIESPDELANASTAFNTAQVNSETGLIIEDVQLGTGAAAEAGKTLTVNYVGAFENGEVFDRGQIDFVLGGGQVIAGWDQGLLGMREGGQRVLVIPSNLGYGPDGFGPIPGGATLVFEVELVKAQ